MLTLSGLDVFFNSFAQFVHKEHKTSNTGSEERFMYIPVSHLCYALGGVQ